MSRVSKRRKAILEKITPNKIYAFNEAVALLSGLPLAKFKTSESVDISLNLGVDPRNSSQVVRGAIVLPNGTGKKVRVAVFTQGANVELAKQAGADLIGMEDLAESIKSGEMNFDVVIATPDAMGVVGKLGPVLGPRGLMPNPKVGTVTVDVATAVKNAKAGQVQYRTDKNGIIHSTVGRASFSEEKLSQNLAALLDVIIKAKPTSSKGQYVKRISLSSTMGVGVKVDQGTIAR